MSTTTTDLEQRLEELQQEFFTAMLSGEQDRARELSEQLDEVTLEYSKAKYNEDIERAKQDGRWLGISVEVTGIHGTYPVDLGMARANADEWSKNTSDPQSSGLANLLAHVIDWGLEQYRAREAAEAAVSA